jgi:hypothetical protein
MIECTHNDFEASVTVNRLEDVGRFAADVRIKCRECGKPFWFLGLPGGSAPDRPTRSVDRLEARLPIAPEPRMFPYPIGLPPEMDAGVLQPMPKCPKCGLYVFPASHSDAACERVRALYPMLGEKYE